MLMTSVAICKTPMDCRRPEAFWRMDSQTGSILYSNFFTSYNEGGEIL